MASRNFAQVAPTAATIALNAYIFGYGGHSLVTPHAALKQLWWTDARIEAKVTRAFVVSKLRGEEREFLDRALAFGEGLTDDTYMEWILDRAKRLFLILTEIGVPDQIFGCIDDSWDDDDLPISFDDVPSLELSYQNDSSLNKKFYDMQFVYMLRELKEGAHIEYGPREHIPMEHVNQLPPAVALQPYDRVHFPGRPDEVFMRRKYPLVDKDSGESQYQKFMRDARKAKALSHEHVATCWASYTADNAGFVVSDFVAEHTLGTFIEHRTPTQLMRVSATERPTLLCEWMHCLADALSYLHHQGIAHTSIRPSNIWIDRKNHIAFADAGSLPTFQKNKKAPKSEAYDYAAPESNNSRTPVRLKSSPPPVSSMTAFSKLRKMSTQSFSTEASSSSGSSTGSSTRSNSVCGGATIGSPLTPPTPFSEGRCNSLSSIRSALSPTFGSGPISPRLIRNFSRHIPAKTCPSPIIHMGPVSPDMSSEEARLLQRTTIVDHQSLRDLPAASAEMSDIWSLGCIFLDILTFMVKGKITDFVKFRSTRVTGKNNKFRMDTSFHNEPDKISAWIDILEDESTRHGEQIFRGTSELLRLVRAMMAQNATLRPTAVEVRDRIQEILVGECGVEALCCAGREWSDVSRNDLRDGESTNSPLRDRQDSPLRDELSIATGMLALHPRRKGSDAGSRCRAAFVAAPTGDQADRMSIGSRAASTMTTEKSRRRSSASTATAKLSSWKSKFWSS